MSFRVVCDGYRIRIHCSTAHAQGQHCWTVLVVHTLADHTVPVVRCEDQLCHVHINLLYLYRAVRQSAEVESQMVSVERTLEYAQLEPEPDHVPSDQSKSSNFSTLNVAAKSADSTHSKGDWPSDGKFEFVDVSMRYSPDTPRALHGISFTVNAKEKVAVVGRTGMYDAIKTSFVHHFSAEQ